MIPATTKISVLVAEDHSIVREGLCGLLEASGQFEILGQARTGREAVDLAIVLRPDVILMDIGMPVLNGIDATRKILEENPKARVLILSAYSDDLHVGRVDEAGAAGFLEKQTSVEILTEAIREVANKRTFISPTIARRMSMERRRREQRSGSQKLGSTKLTSREAEVLQLVAEGSANKQIAAEMNISIKTVEKHRQKVMDKLNIHGTASLTRYAMEAGIVETAIQLKAI
jgi:DNA-binding NarL/FixJ family response regulator